MIDLRKAPLEELRAFMLKHTEFTDEERMAITDNLDDYICTIAFLYDRALGIDPNKGRGNRLHGTPNRKSMKYKLRKAAGYSYP